MKQVEKIWAELSAKEVAQESTELSEEVKVELSLIDDVQRISDTTVQLDSRFQKVYVDFYKQWQKAVTLGQWLPWPGLFWVHLVVLAVVVLLVGIGRLGQRWGIR